MDHKVGKLEGQTVAHAAAVYLMDEGGVKENPVAISITTEGGMKLVIKPGGEWYEEGMDLWLRIERED